MEKSHILDNDLHDSRVEMVAYLKKAGLWNTPPSQWRRMHADAIVRTIGLVLRPTDRNLEDEIPF